MVDFKPGQPVLAENAVGDWMRMTAISGVLRDGYSFPVVLICAPDDWGKPTGQRDALPWPAGNVRPAPTTAPPVRAG